MRNPTPLKHVISFFASVTINKNRLITLYPVQNAGTLYAYYNRYGLFEKALWSLFTCWSNDRKKPANRRAFSDFLLF